MAATYNVSIDNVAKDFLTETVKKVLDVESSKYVKELQEALRPSLIKFDTKEITVDKKKHIRFKDVLYDCVVHKQVFLSGPTGSGKTTLGAQIAESMSVPFYFISCSMGMSEAHLLGRMLFDGTYVASDFIRAYENGGVFLFDEIDAADNNTLLVINSALANGRVSIPNRKDKAYAERHPNFVCIVAGNSWGEGTIDYQGRAPLDKAFIDRFSLTKIEIDYDLNLERLIVSDEKTVSDTFHKLRDYLKAKSISRAVSTRTIASAYKNVKNGHSLRSILEKFIIGWGIDEVKQVEAFMKSNGM